MRVGREEFEGATDAVVEAAGMPVPSPAAVPQYLLAREARKQARILLSGYGGDHLMGGPRVVSLMRELRGAGVIGRLPPRARGQLRRAVGPRLGSFVTPPEHYGLDRLVGGSDVFDADARAALLRDPAHVRPGMRRAVLEPLYNEIRSDPVNVALHVYFRGWLAEDCLLRSDRVSSAVGLEVRYPILDDEGIGLIAGWPGGAKIKRRWMRWHGKWPARQLLERWELPDQLVWRPKRGLPNRLNAWLRQEGERFLWDRVDALCDDPLGIFRPDTIRAMARAHARGEADRGPQLWALIFFDLWWRRLRSA